jgi:hypothetical protein
MLSIHSQPNPEEQAPSRDVAVLVHITDIRTEPKLRFLADPWDLFEDGQLRLESTGVYNAQLRLRLRNRPAAGSGEGEVGFDAIQIRSSDGVGNGSASGSGSKDVKGKGVERMMPKKGKLKA